MNTIKRFTEGFDFSTFKGMGYLLWLNIKKQLALWILTLIVVFMSMVSMLSMIEGYKNYGYSSLASVRDAVRTGLILGTLVPLTFVTLFSIPSTLNSMHKTTLIKRIGATRLNENSFIFIITIWYSIIAFAIVSILFIGMTLVARSAATPEMHLLNNFFKAYIFTFFVTILMVTFGVMLGTLKISQILISVLSCVLLIFSFIFGGFMFATTNLIAKTMPTFTSYAIIINPYGFASYSMASILVGSYSFGTTTLSLVYMSSATLLFYFIAAWRMSFNKIR